MSKRPTDLLNLNFLSVFMYLISVTTHTHIYQTEKHVKNLRC